MACRHLIATVLAVAVVGSAQIGKAGKKEEWISLFDGRTLRGWHTNPQRIGHGTGGQWSVEDGAIVGQQDPPGSGNGGILLTDRQFGDFELLIEMKPDWGVCSGVFLRSNQRGQCYQMMVDYHDRGNVGHIYGEGIGGFTNRAFSIFGVYGKDRSRPLKLRTEPTGFVDPHGYTISGPQWVKIWKLNDWNTARIRVVGHPPKITTWINGVKVCEFDARAFEHPRYDKRRVMKLIGPKGHIAVQVHGGKGWPVGAKCRWRNIKIKILD